MNIFLLTSLILVISFIPAIIATIRGDAIDRLIGMSLGGIISTLCLITLAVGTGRSIYIDVALTVAFLSFSGTIAFARFLERWL